jgi:hypothetical protein
LSIMIWLTVTKYPYLKWQWIFTFYVEFFHSSITDKTLTGLCIWVTRGCLIRSRNYLPLASTQVHPRFRGILITPLVSSNSSFSGSFLFIVLVFLCCSIMCLHVLCSVLCCPIMCLHVLSSVLCPLRLPHKNDVRFVFTSSCRRTHVMFTLC